VETFGVPLLKTKDILDSDLPNCEGSVKNRLLILMSFRPMAADPESTPGFEPAITRLKGG
jgi:hypothetical protein